LFDLPELRPPPPHSLVHSAPRVKQLPDFAAPSRRVSATSSVRDYHTLRRSRNSNDTDLRSIRAPLQTSAKRDVRGAGRGEGRQPASDRAARFHCSFQLGDRARGAIVIPTDRLQALCTADAKRLKSPSNAQRLMFVAEQAGHEEKPAQALYRRVFRPGFGYRAPSSTSTGIGGLKGHRLRTISGTWEPVAIGGRSAFFLGILSRRL
jgi:hypothetical protein